MADTSGKELAVELKPSLCVRLPPGDLYLSRSRRHVHTARMNHASSLRTRRAHGASALRRSSVLFHEHPGEVWYVSYRLGQL